MFKFFRNNNPAVLEKQRQAWEKTRQRGKLHFVFTKGVLGWGSFMFIATTCMGVFVDHQKLDWPLVLTGLVFWPLAGYGWGLWMWSWLDNRFHGSTDQPLSIIEK